MITLHFDGKTIDVQEDDDSYRYRALMQKPQLILKLHLTEYTEFPVGTWCEFQGKRYTLHSAQNVKKNATRDLEVTLTMGGEEDMLADYKLINPVDGRLKFSMCAKPHEFIDMIVENLNSKGGETVWSRGTCIDATEKTVEFNHVSLDAVLADVANEFDTEWEIVDGVISLCKVEHFKDAPLALSYGKGNGFIPGVGRTTYSDQRPVKRVYVQGGEQNIDYSTYGSYTLLLPKSQTLEFEGQTYTSDENGNYIERTDKTSKAIREESLDCSEIYPKRVGTISAVDVPDEENNFYDIVDNSIPDNLNFEDCLIEGETMTIIFQSGMLAGREFDVKYIHNATDEKAGRRFEIVPAEMDGFTMPGGVYVPAVGDTYAVFHCMLPDAYICDNATKTGASWDMFREAAKYLYENEDQKFTFSGELQGLWAKKNWANIGGKLIVGGYVHFTDDQFALDGADIRITGVKDYIGKPYSPTIEISNEAAGQSISSTLREIERTEILLEEKSKAGISYTKRRFRDAKETMEMFSALLNAGFDNFTTGISPITVQTMQMLVGDESLQFRFVNNKTNPQQVTPNFEYNNSTKQLTIPATILQHMTLGVKNISSEHDVSEYKFWDMVAYTSAVLAESSKKYYLYAKCSKSDNTGEFILSETAIKMEGVSGFYHFLTGILNSEYDGTRSFVTCYGYTEILPGRITTDAIVSPDGNTYFNITDGLIGGNIQILAGSSGYNNLSDKPDLSVYQTTADFNVKYNQISGQVTKLNTSVGNTESAVTALQNWKTTAESAINANKSSIYALQTAGFITKAEGNTLYAAAADMNGKTIASLITQTPEAITLISKNINLQGLVTFSSLDSSLQGTLNNKVDMTAVNTAVNNVKTQIEGKGYLTNVDWDSLSEVSAITGGFEISKYIVCKNLHATTGAKIGNFNIVSNWLSAKSGYSEIIFGDNIISPLASSTDSMTALICNYRKVGDSTFKGTAYGLRVRAEGDWVNGKYSVGLRCEGSLQLRGGLSALKVADSRNSWNYMNMRYFDTFVWQPTAATGNLEVVLPTVAQMKYIFNTDEYLADSTHISSVVATIQFIVTRHATHFLRIKGTDGCPLVKKDGSTGYKDFTKGQSGQFTYYNGAWYCTSLRNG